MGKKGKPFVKCAQSKFDERLKPTEHVENMFVNLSQYLKGRIFFKLRGWQIYLTDRLDDAAAAILRAAIRQTLYNQLLVAPDTV